MYQRTRIRFSPCPDEFREFPEFEMIREDEAYIGGAELITYIQGSWLPDGIKLFYSNASVCWMNASPLTRLPFSTLIYSTQDRLLATLCPRAALSQTFDGFYYVSIPPLHLFCSGGPGGCISRWFCRCKRPAELLTELPSRRPAADRPSVPQTRC